MPEKSAGSGRSGAGGQTLGWFRFWNAPSSDVLVPRPWTLDRDGEALSPADRADDCVACGARGRGSLCSKCMRSDPT